MKTSVLQDQKPISKSTRSIPTSKLSQRERPQEAHEQRLLTNQQDQSYVLTIVGGKLVEQNATNNGRDSYSAIQDEAKFSLDDGQNSSLLSFKGKDESKKDKFNNIQSSHLLKMLSAEGFINYSNQNLSEIPKQLTAACFRQISGLDISSNLICHVNEQLIQCLPCLRTLQLSSNKISFITPSIKKLRHLKVLKLNSNCLNMLPNEVGDLIELEELDVSDNKLYGLPDTLCNCSKLKTLNLAHNQIKYLPPEIDQLQNLTQLYIENNLYSSFPCSFGRLKNIKEFSLDWFKYMNPPLPILIQSSAGEAFLEMMKKLCDSLIQNDKYECDLLDFLKFFSDSQLEINQTDSRQRTILHNACANGDLGVIRALVMQGADLNILDKDDCTPLCIAIRDFQYEAAYLD